MKLIKGQVYKNTTWRFLKNCLAVNGPEFRKQFKKLFKLAYAVYDLSFVDESLIPGRNIFVVFDVSFDPEFFETYLYYIRRKEQWYTTDYPYTINTAFRQHVIVFKVPAQFHDTYDYFLDGLYSKMYNAREIQSLFVNNNGLADAMILTKDPSFYKVYVDKANQKYQTNLVYGESITDAEIKGRELELPLHMNEEVLNCDSFTVLTKEKAFWLEENLL